MHVISFDTINEESNPLKMTSDVFKVRFFNAGRFTYRCSIYTRMRGVIEVADAHQQ
jgi:plastocyanin